MKECWNSLGSARAQTTPEFPKRPSLLPCYSSLPMDRFRIEEPGAYTADEGPDSAAPVLSIVIPAYNEASRIGSSLEQILSFVEAGGLASEIIVVDDCSKDATRNVAFEHGGARLRVLSNDVNRGKGYSVRRGAAAARGQWVLFTDADLSAPIEEVEQLFAAIRSGADIAIGSRAIDRSKIITHQSRNREVGGVLYNWAVRLILGLEIYDTQCGFKLFDRKKLIPIFEAQTVNGFGFDPEILFLATKNGLKIREVPVIWSHSEGSTVRVLLDGARMVLGLIRIRWRWIIGSYQRPMGQATERQQDLR
jgi:dolichyl-phosphate beta-glucosyltransferase